MHEILSRLTSADRVLDLGSQYGSFPREATAAQVFRLDLEPATSGNTVAADACHIPFRDGVFAAVIANHSLEHIAPLDEVLMELARVLGPRGLVYVAIPDASTLCDRLYRWLARGGGHVNPIVDGPGFGRLLEQRLQLPLAAMRTLHTSFSYLNRKGHGPLPRRVWLVGGGWEWTLRVGSLLFRWLDHGMGTRLSVYGWSYVLGDLAVPAAPAWRNVCLRCGAAHPAESLPVRYWLGLVPVWNCPNCGAVNGYTRDR